MDDWLIDSNFQIIFFFASTICLTILMVGLQSWKLEEDCIIYNLYITLNYIVIADEQRIQI